MGATTELAEFASGSTYDALPVGVISRTQTLIADQIAGGEKAPVEVARPLAAWVLDENSGTAEGCEILCRDTLAGGAVSEGHTVFLSVFSPTPQAAFRLKRKPHQSQTLPASAGRLRENFISPPIAPSRATMG